MAKSKKPSEASGKLAGKTVALVGKFGYRDMQKSRYENLIKQAGGRIVDTAKVVPDCVVVGEGRGGKPPGDLTKLQKKAPAIDVLNLDDFVRLTLPDREQLLREISQGQRDNQDRFWDELSQSCREAGAKIDLSKADLRKSDLRGAHLEGVVLTGSDLREARLEYAQFGDLEKVNFDESKAKNVYLGNAKGCTFRGSNLEHAWMFYDPTHAGAQKVEQCDFSRANMQTARLERGRVSDSKCVGTDLSDAKLGESIFERVDFTKAKLSRIHAAKTKLDGCTLTKADLSRADLRGASLAGADLRNANLREAVLSDADLTDANIAGADFQDAVLTGTNLKGLDLSKAKNYKPPVVRTAGPKLREFAAAAQGAQDFCTSVNVDLGPDEYARLRLEVRGKWMRADSRYYRDDVDIFDQIAAPSFEQALLNLVDRWPKATLRLDSVSVEAKGSKSVKGKKLAELATAAWAESYGAPVLSAEELKAQRLVQEAEAKRERDALLKKVRAQGAKVWNDLDYQLRDRIDLAGADFNGGNLDKLELWGRKLKEANFAGASLVEAEFLGCDLTGASFTAAKLNRARFEGANLNGANFRDASMIGANLDGAKLLGADFTGAAVKGAGFSKAQFDEKTKFPARFAPPADAVWKGTGPRPGAKPVKAAKAGSLDFDSFLTLLQAKVEAERMSKARSMLKAERFQLFAEVKDDSLVGIVKSQSDKDLVYSCRLTATGAFSCCTQNLRPCGGLRGALCKHLLVLIVGLAKAGQVDSATVDHWIELSRGYKPAIDEEVMSATFLRYKGAEAGELDWRPTETIPEDFYAM